MNLLIEKLIKRKKNVGYIQLTKMNGKILKLAGV